MANFRFELNEAGVRELLKSAEMAAICQEYAEQVAAEYDGESTVSVHTGKTRVNASVEGEAGRYDNELLRALGRVAGNG